MVASAEEEPIHGHLGHILQLTNYIIAVSKHSNPATIQ